MSARTREDILRGTLLGTLVGDALGLPREGLSRQRARRMQGDAPLRHRLLLGRGVGSDDTEHACMTAQALLARPEAPEAFARSLAWRLRGWLLALPAGVGWATVRAITRLWLGFSPERSGVASAGNGPSMRAPVLGVCLSEQPERLAAFVRASSRLTHRDTLAEEGARVVALAAAEAAHKAAVGKPVDASVLLSKLRASASVPALVEALDAIGPALERGDSAATFADARGLSRGVTGYTLHTVPVALYAWLRHPGDFRAALEATILLGGDTDSTGAIVGGLAGAQVGASGIPTVWVAGLVEWPRSPTWLARLAGRLAEAFPAAGEARSPGPLPLFWPALLPRNLAVLCVVLAHGLRRLLPPW
ncbi:ADP-ribosylglycohydrolase family protein [Myxococcaceae bacterium GXIMD 01537]